MWATSARGLAIDSGMERPEEFPDFIAYWLQRPAKGDTRLVVYALMDSPSITGAYRFEIEPGAEMAALAGQQNRADGRVAAERAERVADRA